MTDSDPRAAKRAELVEALAAIALADGLDALSLRPAATRLGTSDRMLLYYFGTKAALMRAVLLCISDRLADWLVRAGGEARVHPQRMIGQATELITQAEARPFMQIWLEIVARAGRGDALFAEIAAAIVERWIDWLVARVDFSPGVDARPSAAMMLAIVDGIALLDLAAPSIAAAARSRVSPT